MIQRYEDTYDGMDLSDVGYWVTHEDHLAEIAKKDEEIKELKALQKKPFLVIEGSLTEEELNNYKKNGETIKFIKPLEPTYIDCRGNGGMYTAPPLEGNEEPLQIQEPEE